MNLDDVTPEAFFAGVTFLSDPDPLGKLVIPDSDFIQSAILLKLILTIEQLQFAVLRTIK